MRTIDATLQTALASGAYNAYFKAYFWINTSTITFTMENIVEYKLTGDSLMVKGVYQYGVDDYDKLWEIQLERGVIVNGIAYGEMTSRYKIRKALFDGNYLTIEADLLGFEAFSRAGDVSWTTLLTDFFAGYGFTITKKDSTEAFWSNQVLPAGKTFAVNKGQQIKTFMKQKAFMGFADNGNQNVVIFAVKERVYGKTQEYSIDLEQILNITDNLIIDTGYVGLLYKDESDTVYKPVAPFDAFPLYNIGFLKTGDVLMTASSGAGAADTADKVKYTPQLIDPVDIAMNLNYQTGDHVRIKSAVTNVYKYGRLLVTEYFDQRKAIPWGLTISLWDYIGSTEGGTLPPVIEAATPYTPLNTSHFSNILSIADNNIQSAMEAIDDHTHASYTPPATTAANDVQVGDGAGAWIKKTLAQFVTILQTSLDSVYAILLASTASNDFQVGNGSGGWIKKTLAEVKTILGLGTAAYTASSDYAVAAKGVTNGDSHDHAGGDGGQIAYSGLSGKPAAETNAENIFGVTGAGVSVFVGTIATLPGGATLTYNITSGNENAMVPTATTQLGKMRLYNTTRGTYALISNCVIATNTITLTANVPAGWTVTDAITIASPTVSGLGLGWVDIEITSGPVNKTSMFINYLYKDTGAAAIALFMHPTEAFASSKTDNVTEHVANITNGKMALTKIISNVFTVAWQASGANTATMVVREAGYLE